MELSQNRQESSNGTKLTKVGCLVHSFLDTSPLQLPAGVLVDKYGGKTVCGVGLFLSSFFTLITPLAAKNSFQFVTVMRVCVGLSQGVIYPALLALLRNWSPSGGKNQVVAIATAGTETGAILAFFLGGILCDSNILGM